MNGYLDSWTFVAQYCVYVFVAFVGLLQLVAARWNYKGISFLRNKTWGYAFGTAVVAGVFIWFFIFTGLDLSEPTFDTPPQLFWLSVSVACAFLFTLAASSLIKRRQHRPGRAEDADKDGLDVLKRKTYWQAIAHYFKRDERQ
jgi:hypothetical protein